MRMLLRWFALLLCLALAFPAALGESDTEALTALGYQLAQEEIDALLEDATGWGRGMRWALTPRRTIPIETPGTSGSPVWSSITIPAEKKKNVPAWRPEGRDILPYGDRKGQCLLPGFENPMDHAVVVPGGSL
mgnify:CR=1 FL=1